MKKLKKIKKVKVWCSKGSFTRQWYAWEKRRLAKLFGGKAHKAVLHIEI